MATLESVLQPGMKVLIFVTGTGRKESEMFQVQGKLATIERVHKTHVEIRIPMPDMLNGIWKGTAPISAVYIPATALIDSDGS